MVTTGSAFRNYSASTKSDQNIKVMCAPALARVSRVMTPLLPYITQECYISGNLFTRPTLNRIVLEKVANKRFRFICL